MPTQCRAVTAGTSDYVQLAADVNGPVTITFNNISGNSMRVIGERDTAPLAANTTYALFASQSGACIKVRADPSKTWILANTGGVSCTFTMDW